MGTKRSVSPQDQAKFWAAMQAGKTQTEAARIAGIHVNTANKWVKKLELAKAREATAELELRKHVRDEGGKQRRDYNNFMDAVELPGAIPHDRLCDEAKKGLEDFGFFREYYLGRLPSPWQVEAAVTLVELEASEEKEFVVVNVPPGAGKALALDTPLKTPTGWTTIQNVQIGDYVLGANGEPVKVLAKSEVFTNHKCFTVTTDDGHSVVADANHLWPVRLHGYGQYKHRRNKTGQQNRGPKPKSVDGITTKTTVELAKKRSKKPQLQLTQPIEYPTRNLLIDPYILGVWLGDGSSRDGRIACHENDQLFIREQFHNAGFETTNQSHTQSFGVLKLKEKLKQINVLENKHVPDEYLYSSVEQRIALIQGLIDTDGYVSPTGQVEFCNTNRLLAEAVTEIVLSLGVKCSIKESRAKLYGKDCGPRWRVNFRMDKAARLPRKAQSCRANIRTPNRYLTVQPTETVPTQCIQVEGGLFLAGTGLLVTHNSTLMHDLAVWSICRNRAIRILIGSVSQNMAKMYSRRIRETLERPMPLEPDPELIKKGLAQNAKGCLGIDYGRFKPTDKGALWRAEEFVVEQLDGNGLDNKEPTVRAYGIEAEFIGHRADMCLFDDVSSPDNSRESVARDKLLERWDNVAEARVDPGGLLAVIGQRLGPGDLYAHCLAKVSYDEDIDDIYDGSDIEDPEQLAAIEPLKHQKYRHIIYKAFYEDLDQGTPAERKAMKRFDAPAWPDGPLLDPKRLPWKDLSYIRHSKPDVFRVVYQQEDLDLDSMLIDRTWITGGRGMDGVDYVGCIDNDRQPGHVPPNLAAPWVSFITIDPSPTMFWALMWIIYQPDINLYHVVDVERCKLTAEELLGYNVSTQQYSGMLEEWVWRAEQYGYPVSHVIVEINAAQRFLLAHDFVRRWQSMNQLNIIGHTTHRNKIDENMGIEALLPPLIRTGSVRMPTMRGNWKTLALTEELTKWTRDKKNGTDLVMALWFAALHGPNVSGVKKPPRMWRPNFMLTR